MTTTALTYAELAAALGITPASAKRLAIRHKWQKAQGNDGLARVMVPTERLEEATTAKPAAGDKHKNDASDITSAIPGAASGVVAGDATNDARALIAELQRQVTALAEEVRENRTTIADLAVKAGRADVFEARFEAEHRRAEELKLDRDKLLDRALAAPPTGLLSKLKRALAG